jgi:hypothetical protein
MSMKRFFLTIGIVLVSLVFLSPGIVFNKIDYEKGRKNNVCKVFKGDVLVYFIFVDTRTTSPWTEFDIRTTMDSISVASEWLMKEAKSNNIELNIKTDFYVGEDYSTIRRDLPEGTIRKSITYPSLPKGIAAMNKWADVIANMAGRSFELSEKDGIPEVKNPRNKERLVAYLRDEHRVESVALFIIETIYLFRLII